MISTPLNKKILNEHLNILDIIDEMERGHASRKIKEILKDIIHTLLDQENGIMEKRILEIIDQKIELHEQQFHDVDF